MKLVKENILFTRGSDPKKTLGIGEYKLIQDWLEKMEITDYRINDDMTIDIYSANLYDKNLENFPSFIQFNNCESEFIIQYNKFTTLRGCPKYVGTNFSCSLNLLESLEYCPKYVGQIFWCYSNKNFFPKKYVRSLCTVKGEIDNKR